MRLLSSRLLVSFWWMAAAAVLPAADEAPGWLSELAAKTLPAYGPKVSAVVLLSEERAVLEDTGRVVSTTRFAVRILHREGSGAATARKPYDTESGKVRDFQAWMIQPSGKVKKYGKQEILDAALVDNDIYNEYRVRMVLAQRDADAGAVFGFEATSERRSVFTQFEWQFQARLPVLASRLTVTVPADWRAEAVTLNHAPIEAAVSGSTYTWQLENLPYIEDEEASPPVSSLSPRVAVSCFPQAGARAGLGKTFANWAEVSRWLTELNDPQMEPDASITAKAKELTQAASTELDKLRALGRFAQSVNYVSIQTGIGRGGGYRPHAAAEVFKKMYGDCKDKANLMRSLLKAVGMQSYPVSIYSGDRLYVRENWASPQQFNHAILAIKVSDATDAPAIVKHPALGRLLFFDPTDPDVPLGLLPPHEQASLALVVAGDAGGLVRMPITPPGGILFERTTQAAILTDGSVSGTVEERRGGEAAASARGARRALSGADYQARLERWITYSLPGGKLEKLEVSDDAASGEFRLKAGFASPRFAQAPQPRMLLFRAGILRQRESLRLTDPKRKHPVVLDSESFAETVNVKLPPGYAVDEVPDPVKLSTAFGSFEANWESAGDGLVFRRKLLVPAATVPVEKYGDLKKFFDQAYGAAESPVVLVRK